MTDNLTQLVKNIEQRVHGEVAFSFADQKISFVQLKTRCAQTSHALIDKGVVKGDRVGILMNRCLESPIAVHSILAAGAAFVPIDPKLPESRILEIIKDCGLKHILTTEAQKKVVRGLCNSVDSLHFIGCNITDISTATFTSWDIVTQSDKTLYPDLEIHSTDLAYIMYTSGSTGKPKGIMHTHGSGLSYVKLSAELFDLTSKDVIGNTTALNFDISTFGYLTSPYAGAETVIFSDMELLMAGSLKKQLIKKQVSILYSVPYLIMSLFRDIEDQINHLRLILFGGEVFPTPQLINVMKKLPDTKFCNVYGPAEVNQCTYYFVPKDILPDSPVPIGIIWNETVSKLLDENGEPIPDEPMAVGELAISSTTQMEGYWNHQTLTKSRLFIDPESGKTFFKTGDLVKRDKDGYLIYLHRLDRQVKIRGYRVELSEVELAIDSYPGVIENAVFSQDSPNGNELKAVIHCEKSIMLGEGDLKSYLKRKLPIYAIPQQFFLIDQMPRTPNGKVDYRRIEKQVLE